MPGFRTTLKALDMGHSVIGIYHERPIPIDHQDLIKLQLDIRDFNLLKTVFEKYRPEIVVHMAALGDVDLCEKDKGLAWSINVLGTVNVVRLASRYSDFLVYLSTDYVFEGEKGGYKEDDPPNPVNYYGITKLMGEVASISASIPAAIVRASSIYGLGPGRVNFARFLIEKLSRGEQVKALIDQYTSPTQASLLGQAIVEIIEKRLEGIFHVVGERMSRYEFALKVAEKLNFDKSLIKPARMEDMKWFARRPRDSSLDYDGTRRRLKTEFYSTERALKILKGEYEEQFGAKHGGQ